MKVINQYVVYINNRWQMLLDCGEHGYYITTNGAFNQRETSIIFIEEEKAKELIKTKP